MEAIIYVLAPTGEEAQSLTGPVCASGAQFFLWLVAESTIII